MPHDILRWTGWDGRGNLQDAARRARQRLIAGWAAEAGVRAVALGHTRDDQAETVLLRLLRGSGVDGLAGMAPVRRQGDLLWLRPMLGLGRAELRGWLADQGLPWADDPSNDDESYERVRARRTMAALGIGAEGLAATAARMATARAALEVATHAAADLAEASAFGEVWIGAAGLAGLPREIALRLLAHALIWVAAAEYRPRLAALSAALDSALGGGTMTLHGCLVSGRAGRAGRIVIAREPAAARQAPDAPPGALWDGRWRVIGPQGKDLRIAALGEAGLAQRPFWRATGASRAAHLAGPAVWRGTVLVAAPLLDALPSPWRAELRGGQAGFRNTILSH